MLAAQLVCACSLSLTKYVFLFTTHLLYLVIPFRKATNSNGPMVPDCLLRLLKPCMKAVSTDHILKAYASGERVNSIAFLERREALTICTHWIPEYLSPPPSHTIRASVPALLRPVQEEQGYHLSF